MKPRWRSSLARSTAYDSGAASGRNFGARCLLRALTRAARDLSRGRAYTRAAPGLTRLIARTAITAILGGRRWCQKRRTLPAGELRRSTERKGVTIESLPSNTRRHGGLTRRRPTRNRNGCCSRLHPSATAVASRTRWLSRPASLTPTPERPRHPGCTGGEASKCACMAIDSVPAATIGQYPWMSRTPKTYRVRVRRQHR